jgi:5'-methylthioadenosine phosphorylase
MVDSPLARLGIIGGSGLYHMPGLENIREVRIETPFGNPSDAITLGTLAGVPLAFLPRHGRGHLLTPAEVPARANIYALKSLGVEWVLSVSAVGSLREDYKPLDLVVPDQIFDRTKSRANTFFEGGIVVHVGFAEPFCPHFSGIVYDTARGAEGVESHRGGTLVVIEGPQFSTKAESRIYRQLGCDIIGMTAIPEAKLAREAELCYAAIASVTDYDVWHESEEPVTVEMVTRNLQHNVANAQRIIRELVTRLPADRSSSTCSCEHALAGAIQTDRALITPQVREKYALFLNKYLA